MGSKVRQPRTAFWLASIAVAWALGATVWVLTASFYEPGGQTILEANEELSVRVALFVPAVASVAVWLALRIACRDGKRAPRMTGLVVGLLLVLFTLITGFTIGSFFLPGAIALTVAAVTTPTGPPRGVPS